MRSRNKHSDTRAGLRCEPSWRCSCYALLCTPPAPAPEEAMRCDALRCAAWPALVHSHEKSSHGSDSCSHSHAQPAAVQTPTIRMLLSCSHACMRSIRRRCESPSGGMATPSMAKPAPLRTRRLSGPPPVSVLCPRAAGRQDILSSERQSTLECAAAAESAEVCAAVGGAEAGRVQSNRRRSLPPPPSLVTHRAP